MAKKTTVTEDIESIDNAFISAGKNEIVLSVPILLIS